MKQIIQISEELTENHIEKKTIKTKSCRDFQTDGTNSTQQTFPTFTNTKEYVSPIPKPLKQQSMRQSHK